jgi:short-subunit dehydrogenase
MPRSRTLREAVVVITGASSGIGRAAAHAFARRGARLVLAARREELLLDVAAECALAGSDALAVRTDVTDESAVHDLARAAVQRFGGIDVWVNNAGVGIYGAFVDVPTEAFRRVLETNLFGCVHGARAVLPHFVQRGRGVLINVASGWGFVGTPYMSSYVASKFALVGLGESLRQELRRLRDVHVCTLVPAGIDTPFYQHAANLTGRTVGPVPPVYSVDLAARAIIELAERPRRERVVGRAFLLLRGLHELWPGLAERVMGRWTEATAFGTGPARRTMGNLFEPVEAGAGESGGWGPLGGRAGRAGTVLRSALHALRPRRAMQ